MQEKNQNISPIKQRILQFAATLGISKREFYAKIGVSRGTLESETGITEVVIAKFFAAFPDVSVEWVITGRGEPFTPAAGEEKDKSGEKGGIPSGGGIIADKLFAIIQEKDGVIRQQAEEIGRLRERVLQLERGKGRSASDAQTSGIADAG